MNHLPKKEQRIILLIEDEETLRRSITFTLMRMGYCVIPMGMVDDGLRWISETNDSDYRILLIITDLQLPGKNGMELVRMARVAVPKVPILIITGHGGREVREELRALGVEDILDKPFDLEQLLTKMRKMLDSANNL